MSIFKVFGWITIALGLVTLCGIAANLTRSTLGGHNLTPLTSVVVLSISIGLGLVFHQKWEQHCLQFCLAVPRSGLELCQF